MTRVLLTLTLLMLLGCAIKRPKQDLSGVRMDANVAVYIEPEAKSTYLQAEKEFQNKNFDQALSLFQTVRTRWSKGKAAELSSYRIASILYYKEDYAKAAREFESFSRKYPVSAFAFDSNYNLAACEYQLGRYERSQQILERLKKEDIRKQGSKRAVTFYQLQALNAVAQQNNRLAVLAYSNQMAFISDEKGKRVIEEKVDEQLEKITSTRDLQELSVSAPDPITRAKASKKLGSQVATKGDAPKQEEQPSFSNVGKVVEAPLELGTGSSGAKKNIGVVLPLTGKFAPYGRRALEGILLASKTFNAGTQEGFSIFVEDSGSSPAMAQAAVDSLFNQKNTMAVIGPLNFKEALAAGEKSQELGVVNLSLASKAGVSEQGPYVFQNALTPKVQLENLVKFSVEDKGLKRFAILAPANAFGKDMANEFWTQVEARGGRVAAVEFYPPNETDFQDQVKSMVGLKDMRFRKAEWTALQDYSKEQKAKTGKDPKIKLKPIVDFDAIFLPDSPKTVASIAANLAYLDVGDLVLLGTTEWNSDQLYKRGGRFVEKAVFPGVMNPITRSPSQREFMRSYQEAYGNQPDLLAAQGYEAMILIGEALQRSQSDNRADLAKQLAALKDFETPIGVTSFDENRVAKRSIPLYTLDRFGNFVEQ